MKKLLSLLLSVALLVSPLGIIIASAIDNTIPPYINVSISNFDVLTPDSVIDVAYFAMNGDTLTYCDTRLEGVSISTSSEVSIRLSDHLDSFGTYTLTMEVSDSSDNVVYEYRTFIYAAEAEIDFSYAEDESIVPSVSGATAQYHKVEPLDYNMGYGTTSDGTVALEDVTAYDDYTTFNVQYYNIPETLESVSGIPYQTFDVELNGKTDGEIVVRYTGSTISGERIAVKAYNPTTENWDMLGTMLGSSSVSETVDVATYADNGVIHVMAILDYVTNGSDTMIWSTDPQHYTKFADLNDYYYTIYQYAAEQYVEGNVGYIMTTGDLVDDLPTTTLAIEQWKIADKAMSYIEEVGMPNGIVSGNHDVGTFKNPDYTSGDATVNYSKYLEYFGAERYNDKAWYGGSLNNNISHYDLVTIGNVDFVVLFLGYGVEATEETIAWANDVLSTYSHRVAIVATHEYLEATSADRSTASRAQLIYDKIVDPNPNVKVVLCGHDDGSILLERTASDGRTVYEILSDYQFVEAEDDSFYENEHYIGSVPECCGDGYIRLLTVEGNTLSSITYSPVTDKYNPYGDRENFSIDLGDTTPQRSISTYNFSAYVLGEVISVEKTFEYPSAIVITKGESKTYHHVSYVDWPDEPEAGENVDVDLAPLNALLAKAKAIDTSAYTADSVSKLDTAIESANTATDIKTAYIALANAIGALEEEKEVIDPATLQSVYSYTMTTANWTSSDAAMTQFGNSGIYMERAAGNTNNWASMRYTGADYDIKPVNGKIYMNLDIDANSAWCIYVLATQGSSSATLRMNFAIDNAFNRTDADSYNGYYFGVYDVTEAFVAAGLDPSATITITDTYLFIVPGDVTYYHVEYMTEVSDAETDFTELNNVIASVDPLDETLYTTASWSKLETALTDANSVANDSAALQADVNLAALELKKAIDNLKLLTDVIPEPEGSLLPADEGKWVPGATGTMNIYRDSDNYTVLQNTNNAWPYADHVLDSPVVATVADKQISIDLTIADRTNIYVYVNEAGNWIALPKYISAANTNNDGDLQAGSYTVDIPLAEITELSGHDSVTISKVRVYTIGSAGTGSSVTVKKLQVTDYVAPPEIEDELYDILANAENFTIVAGEGTAEIKDGVLTINNTGTGDFRISFTTSELYDLETLNALHFNINTDIPFKIALHAQGADETSAWQNTSSSVYSHLFTVENDRVVAGNYNTYLELRDNTSSMTDKSAVYYNTFIVLVTGQGAFTMDLAEAVAYDTFIWPEGPVYGEPATPENNYYEHAAQTAPEVAEKVDLIPYFNSGTHPTVGSTTISTENGLGINIDISKTPYLYYSFAVCDGADFTFSLYSNSTYSPWLSFLDSNIGEATLNKGAANWDSYTSREQYSKVSQTGCIDMRQYLVDENVQKWVIHQMKLYASANGSTVVGYLFFGSDVIDDVPDDSSDDTSDDSSVDDSSTDDSSDDSSVDDSSTDDPSDDSSVDDSSDGESKDDSTDDSSDDSSDTEYDEYALGDVNADGAIDQFDYLLVKRAYFDTYTFKEGEEERADVNLDNAVDQFDYILLKRVYFGTYTIA